MMKKIFFFFLLSFIFISTYAQKYDLIVTTQGDSIACKIDTLTDDVIIVLMRSDSNWFKTSLKRTEVIYYKRNVINLNKYAFIPGTYIIAKKDELYSFKELPRNSIYAGILTINYSRIFPTNEMALNLATGISYIEKHILLQTEATLLFGGTKNFFEPGIRLLYYDKEKYLLIEAGYRYQSTKGFLFRSSLLFSVSPLDMVLPSLSIGYSF